MSQTSLAELLSLASPPVAIAFTTRRGSAIVQAQPSSRGHTRQ